MFHNLDIEMTKAKIKQYELAEKLGITPTTLSLKLNGKSRLSLKECIVIKRAIKSELSIECLFALDEQIENQDQQSG